MTNPDNALEDNSSQKVDAQVEDSATVDQEPASDSSEKVSTYESPAVSSQPVSVVPTPGAVSDPKP